MLTLHHLELSRSQRILWLLEELELPYKIVVYKRDKKTRLAPAELKAIHPLGNSPVASAISASGCSFSRSLSSSSVSLQSSFLPCLNFAKAFM